MRAKTKNSFPSLTKWIGFNNSSEYKLIGLAYIAGFIVRELVAKLDCSKCCESMIEPDRSKWYLSLISTKDNGGLTYPSQDIVQIVTVCEKYFKRYVSGDDYTSINSSKNLRVRLTNSIVKELSTTRPGKILFQDLLEHDVHTHNPCEDLHSTQIMKGVIQLYLRTRLYRYGQDHTRRVIKAKSIGKRQQMNKLKLFAGI